MPWGVKQYENRGLPAAAAQAAGGYTRAERPNPNSAMATFQRGQTSNTQNAPGLGASPFLPKVATAAPVMGDRVNNMNWDVGAGAGGTDPYGQGLKMRAAAMRGLENLNAMQTPEALEYNTGLKNNPGSTMVVSPTGTNVLHNIVSTGGYLPESQWEGFKQALYERGVDKLRTSAAAHQGPRGYFDTQDTSSPTRLPHAQYAQYAQDAMAGLKRAR